MHKYRASTQMQANIMHAKKIFVHSWGSRGEQSNNLLFLSLSLFQETVSTGLITRLSTNVLSFILCPCSETNKKYKEKRCSRANHFQKLTLLLFYSNFANIVSLFEDETLVHEQITFIPYGQMKFYEGFENLLVSSKIVMGIQTRTLINISAQCKDKE